MSTKPWRRNGIGPAAALAVAALCAACAGPAPEPGHGFSEVRFHRVAPPPAPAYLQPPPAAAAAAAAASATPPPADPTGAADRVRALLTHDGFTVEDRRDGDAHILAATRMAAPDALGQEAVCALQAMRRPDFSASDLDVRLAPGSAAVSGRFVLIDTNLISGDLTRQTCRSNGLLEAAVRRAAAG